MGDGYAGQALEVWSAGAGVAQLSLASEAVAISLSSSWMVSVSPIVDSDDDIDGGLATDFRNLALCLIAVSSFCDCFIFGGVLI